MKPTNLKTFILYLCLAGCYLLVLALSISCDTPKSIAWSYYYCAKDTLEAGDPYAARRFLQACNASADKTLAHKVDSLMTVIEKEINDK